MTDQQAWKAEVLAKIEELETRLRESSGHVLALQDLLLKAAAEAEARETPARILERITDDELVMALHRALDPEGCVSPPREGDRPEPRLRSRVVRLFRRLVAFLRKQRP